MNEPTQPAFLRAVLLLCGTIGCVLLATWVTMLDRVNGRFVLTGNSPTEVHLPTWLVFAAAACIGLGGAGVLLALWRDQRLHALVRWSLTWAREHRVAAGVVAAAFAIGAFDIYELLYDRYNARWGDDGAGGLRMYMLREDVEAWLLLGASVMGALAVSAVRRERTASAGDAPPRWCAWWCVAIITPMVLGATMCLGALDGIPHFADSLTYLMQGRIMQTGRLVLHMPDAQLHELFQHSLFVLKADERFFGKYPIGWPAVLGLFDALRIGFVANAVLTGLLALLTGLTALQYSSKRAAVIAALAVGLSPWVWFNGAGFASHVASACAVTGFLWLFIRTLRREDVASAIGAGLMIGAAVLVRPFDATMFALPAVGVVLWKQVTRPRPWLGLGTLMALGGAAGVVVYMLANWATTGDPLVTPYKLEGRFESDWNSPLHMLGRAVFQWADLNGRHPGWGVGGFTVAVMGAIAAGARWRTPGLRLVTASTLLFFAGATAFGFTNVWWGPRWLLPVIPLLAMLTGELGEAIMGGLRSGDATRRRAAALAVMLACAGVVVGVVGRYGGQFYRHQLDPPHAVSAGAHERVRAMGLADAVVAMPVRGAFAPLDARAGMAFMTVPFEKSDVIYVRAIRGWQEIALRNYPGRALYELMPDKQAPHGFVIRAASAE